MVPRIFPESTIVCVGSGPSLDRSDIDACQAAGCRILTINTAYQLCRDADIVYAPDARFWGWYPDALRLPGLKYAFQIEAEGIEGVTVLQRTGYDGLEMHPRGLRSGGHSGYAAINLAVHLGARRIILLGYDLSPSATGQHHFNGGDHPDGSHLPSYDVHRDVYDTLVQPLKDLNITILNASRVSMIMAFTRVPLYEALGVPCSL